MNRSVTSDSEESTTSPVVLTLRVLREPNASESKAGYLKLEE